MSTKLTKALEFANYRVTLNNQQKASRERCEMLLTYSVNGGTFTIDQSLIVFSKMLLETQEEAVLLDVYENPILVNLKEFHTEVSSRYVEAVNEYYTEYEKLKKARKVHTVLEINEETK